MNDPFPIYPYFLVRDYRIKGSIIQPPPILLHSIDDHYDDPYIFLEAARGARHYMLTKDSITYIEKALEIAKEIFCFKEILIEFYVEYALILATAENNEKGSEILKICEFLFKDSLCWNLEDYVKYLIAKFLIEKGGFDIAFNIIKRNISETGNFSWCTTNQIGLNLRWAGFIEIGFRIKKLVVYKKMESNNRWMAFHELLYYLLDCRQIEIHKDFSHAPSIFLYYYNFLTEQEWENGINYYIEKSKEIYKLLAKRQFKEWSKLSDEVFEHIIPKNLWED